MITFNLSAGRRRNVEKFNIAPGALLRGRASSRYDPGADGRDMMAPDTDGIAHGGAPEAPRRLDASHMAPDSVLIARGRRGRLYDGRRGQGAPAPLRVPTLAR